MQVALDNHLWGIFVLAQFQYPHAFFSVRCLVVVLAEFILFIRFQHVFVGAELQRNICKLSVETDVPRRTFIHCDMGEQLPSIEAMDLISHRKV